jgi:hypothetical protein
LKSDASLFKDKNGDMILLLHVDDMLIAGEEQHVEDFWHQLCEKMTMKEVGVLRMPGDRGEYLGRVIVVTESGFIMTAKDKYIDQLVSEFGLEQAKTIDNPSTRMTKENELLRVELLDDEETTAYRGQTGRIMYVSHDRIDTQYAAMRLAQGMSKPTRYDKLAVSRTVKYLKSRKHLWYRFEERRLPEVIVGYADSDWAGAPDRRSTSGGIILLGSAISVSWARIQRSIALSSAEAEYAAILMAYAEAKFVQTVIQELLDMQKGLQLRIMTDSSAAKAAAERAGVRRMKHMELKQLFLQDVVKSGELQLVKTQTQANPADMLTKAVTGPGLRRCMQMLPGLSHQDWPEDEPEHVTSTAHAMLVEVLTEQNEQALSLSCAGRGGLSGQNEMDKNKPSNMSVLESVLLYAVLFETVVIACLCACARCSRRNRGKRTVAVQSQTTYTSLRGVVQPRFHVLPERDSGAWSD